MRNPAEILGNRLSRPSSRRGFLATLGKLAVLGGAAFAAVSREEAYAACAPSDCVVGGHNYGEACPSGDSDSYFSCCKTGSTYYETHQCERFDPSCGCYDIFDCFYTFGPVAPDCPQVRG